MTAVTPEPKTPISAFERSGAVDCRRADARRAGVVQRFVRGRGGATAVEFAIILPVLLMMVMGTLEIGTAYTADVILKSATNDAARLGRTGFVAAGTTQDAAVRKIITDRASLLMDSAKLQISSQAYTDFGSVGKPEPFVDANKNGKRDNGENYTDVNKNGKYDLDQGVGGLGGANEIVVYTVKYPWTFVTPIVGDAITAGGPMTLTATAVVQNEPY